ncbi:MAG: CopG family transcriptional regulator [Planctomycetes bacterium]|nr:CopG family transcriptional regulator [Planctomycetota bacterium]
MNAKQAAQDTSEFDREFVADAFGEPDEAARDKLERAKRKPGSPVRGAGAKAISVTVEKSILARADALAQKLGITRAQLIERALTEELARAGMQPS